MILNKIEDPRDSLDKARRPELVRFAHANGITDITEDWPAILIRKQLRSRGLTRISIPRRSLGQTGQAPTVSPEAPQKGVEVNADDDLMRQFRATVAPQPKANAPMGITEMRQECKRRGIKMARTDNMQTLREKLGQNPT